MCLVLLSRADQGIDLQLKLDGLDGCVEIGALTTRGHSELPVVGTLEGPRQETGRMVEVETHVGGTCAGTGCQSLGTGMLELSDTKTTLSFDIFGWV